MQSQDAATKRVVLIVANAASFLAPFMLSATNVALPSIGAEFSLDAISLSWVVTAYLLAMAVFMVPLGRIADLYGRKRVFLYGMLLFTVSALLAAHSNSAIMLISLRAAQGVAAAMILGTSLAILTSVYGHGERGRVLGIYITAVYSGLSLGPFLGGLLTQYFGWRSIFLGSVPVGGLIIAAVFWKLKGEWREARGEKFDLKGSVIYGIAISLIGYGISLLPSPVAIWLIVAGIAGLVVFIRWETKTVSPVINISLFRNNPVFSFSNLAALINYSATFAVSFLLSLYLQYIKALTPERAGLVLVSMPAMQALFSPLAGRLSDRIEPRVLASIGMAFTVTGLVLFIFLSQNTPLGYILASLLILGFGFALFSSPNSNAIMSSVEKQFYGVASGILGTMRLLGQMVSMGIATLIFALFLGRVEITPEHFPAFLRSLEVAFIIMASLCFIGVFASLARGKMRS